MDGYIVDSKSDIKTIDKRMKNAWNWQWLEKCADRYMVSTHIRKLNIAGIARCILCAKAINYGNGCFTSIQQHMSKKIHTSVAGAVLVSVHN